MELNSLSGEPENVPCHQLKFHTWDSLKDSNGSILHSASQGYSLTRATNTVEDNIVLLAIRFHSAYVDAFDVVNIQPKSQGPIGVDGMRF
jgi:hypothetical protein